MVDGVLSVVRQFPYDDGWAIVGHMAGFDIPHTWVMMQVNKRRIMRIVLLHDTHV